MVSPTASISELSAQISEMVSSSPNCQEFMSKYKKKSEGKESVTELNIKWSPVGRDPKMWPQTTIVTEDNIDAVLAMVERSGVGRDVLEVKMAEGK
jgi:hypothetical protein